MHLIFPKKIEEHLRFLKFKIMPRTLFFRTMLLIFIPLIVVQVVSIIAFFDGTWGRVGKRLSSNLTSNMAFAIRLSEESPANIPEIQDLTQKIFDMDFKYYPNEQKHKIMREAKKQNKLVTGFLEDALHTEFPEAITTIYIGKSSPDLVVFIDMENGLYQFATSSKNIFSSSIFGFIAWMVGISLLLFLVAVLFLRIQVRSIADLAKAAEDFGKGIDNKKFKPYGSSEVRRAGIAFIKMKERIQRQISERTQMLAGVSHDLRTPLTRMKLQLAMLPDNQKNGLDKEEFLQDVNEMEKMLEGYLSFVSGEGGEKSSFVDLNEMILSILNKFRNTKALIRYTTNDQVSAIQGREQALKRALTNVIGNAFNYGHTVAVSLESNNNKLEIIVDDDGPGIPVDKRDDVFKAFYRIDDSRNKETGGVGLGLAIAKDVIIYKKKKIELTDAPIGGLRVLISIPL